MTIGCAGRYCAAGEELLRELGERVGPARSMRILGVDRWRIGLVRRRLSVSGPQLPRGHLQEQCADFRR